MRQNGLVGCLGSVPRGGCKERRGPAQGLRLAPSRRQAETGGRVDRRLRRRVAARMPHRARRIRRHALGLGCPRSTTRPTTATGSNASTRGCQPAHLDQAGERRRRPHQQAAVASPRARRGRRRRAARSGSVPASRGIDQRQREPRLADAGRTADQHGAAPTSTAEACTVGHRGCMTVARLARQAHDEARAEDLRLLVVGCRGAEPVLRPEPAAHAPRRSAWRSTGRARNSARSPGAAGRCRSARRSSPSHRGGCPARRRRR